MTIVGGLRARLLKQSVYDEINDALDTLGWFDTGRQHQPVTFRLAAVEDDEEVPMNTMALSDEDLVSMDEELGSFLAEHRWEFWVDIYAESDALGIHLSHDIKALLEGRMASSGRTRPTIQIIDYSSASATPLVIATAQVEDVTVEKAHGFTKPYQRHWYAVSFNVIDYYSDES